MADTTTAHTENTPAHDENTVAPAVTYTPHSVIVGNLPFKYSVGKIIKYCKLTPKSAGKYLVLIYADGTYPDVYCIWPHLRNEGMLYLSNKPFNEKTTLLYKHAQRLHSGDESRDELLGGMTSAEILELMVDLWWQIMWVHYKVDNSPDVTKAELHYSYMTSTARAMVAFARSAFPELYRGTIRLLFQNTYAEIPPIRKNEEKKAAKKTQATESP